MGVAAVVRRRATLMGGMHCSLSFFLSLSFLSLLSSHTLIHHHTIVSSLDKLPSEGKLTHLMGEVCFSSFFLSFSHIHIIAGKSILSSISGTYTHRRRDRRRAREERKRKKRRTTHSLVEAKKRERGRVFEWKTRTHSKKEQHTVCM